MQTNQQFLDEILKDLIKINAVIATELIQLVENSSRQLRGAIPESCKVEHRQLRREVIEIAEKHNKSCTILREHNLKHD
jgi:hypothetical protein